VTTRQHTLAPHEYYHVYNRGTEKRNIFLDGADYGRFIELCYLSNSVHSVDVRHVRRTYNSVYEFPRDNPLVYVGAYCLMPNHFHILLTPATDRGVEKFMLKLGTGYSMYFNKRYERTGTLFQGRFKSRHANNDEYLKYLFAYIHLNPVKLIQPNWKEVGIQNIDGVKTYLDKYPYSSLQDYLGDREESKILDKDKFPEYFSTKQEVDQELIDWLSFRETLQ
jgi:putative transposase